MTQEEKQLLLKDLCARLPYGIFVKENRESLDDSPTIYTFDYHPCIDNCKPYLRPMSSMTEEEEEHCDYLILHIEDWLSYYDYLNYRYMDYRGLIEKGLALEAPKDMYQ